MEIDTIVCGDCLGVMADMPDACVDLVVTDPEYQNIPMYQNIAPELARLLKKDSAALIFCGIGWLDRVLDVLRPALSYRWVFCVWYPSNNMKRADPGGYCKWSCMLWMENGRSKPYKPLQDLRNVPIKQRKKDRGGHDWAKGQEFVDYYVEGFSQPGDLIFDPFMGSGTTAVAALKAGCHFYGCDINQAYIDVANERIAKAWAETQQ